MPHCILADGIREQMGNAMLYSMSEVRDKIDSGSYLLLAGSEQVLRQLPRGNWIGGTTTHFITEEGVVSSESQVFVTQVPEAVNVKVEEYSAENLSLLGKDGPGNGFTFIIIPAGSPTLIAYAQDAPSYEEIYERPVVGWVSGVHPSGMGKESPKVFNGISGSASSLHALVMHVDLPQSNIAELGVINVFRPGSGDRFAFPTAGFSAQECLVNGKPVNFARYLAQGKHDYRLPLTADYNGTVINVSLQTVDVVNDTVKFYAPVFPGVEYRIAEPVADHSDAFRSEIPPRGAATFSCSCILNYLYGALEGKQTGLIGPITFGEIAHQLMNQTAVNLVVRDVTARGLFQS
jgi:uncharacterized protein DUF6976